MIIVRKAASFAAGFCAALLAAAQPALAQGALGAPVPWQMNFQAPATPVMAELVSFHNFVTVLITLISLFVLALLLYIVVRFNAKANPIPSKNTHNTLLEVLWTIIPIAILVIMAIPAFRILYHTDVVPDVAKLRQMYPDVNVAGTMDIKAIGVQWNWTYEYPRERLQFDSFCATCYGEPTSPTQPRLLATTDHVVVPVNTLVRVLVTAQDVIHAWAMPAFGVKIDAVPGRINETWFIATREGLFFGQCSELCGQGHGFMPITVEVVSAARYNAWVGQKRAEIATKDGTRLAAN